MPALPSYRSYTTHSSPLGKHTTSSQPEQLEALGLGLVATSAASEPAAGAALRAAHGGVDSDDDDAARAEEDGDGMAPPAAAVAANAARLASAVGGAAAAGAVDFAEAGAPHGDDALLLVPHALDAVTAARDFEGLDARRAGGGGGGGGGGAGSGSAQQALTARVAQLQRHVSRAAAAAVKAGAAASAPVAAAVQRAATPAAGARPSTPRAASAAGSAAAAGAAAWFAADAHPNAHWDLMATDDEGAQEGPAPEVLLAAAAAAAKETGSRNARAAVSAASRATSAALGRAAALAATIAPADADADAPASQWLVADAPEEGLRLFVIAAPPALEARFGGRPDAQRLAAAADLTQFEAAPLRARVSRPLYAEARALYARLLPLALDHLAASDAAAASAPPPRIAFAGAGVGGAIAKLLTLMAAARGMRHSALAPAVALNAPAVVCEAPDPEEWRCDPRGGCALDALEAMADDAARHGVLARLGLPPTAVVTVFCGTQQGAGKGSAGSARRAAVAAAEAVGVTAAAPQASAGAAVGARAVRGALQRLDSALLRRVRASALVPDALKAWLRAGESAAAAAAASGAGQPPLTILNPLGTMMWMD